MTTPSREPAYLALLANGVLGDRVREAYRRLQSCTLCPRRCKVRRAESVGACRTGERAVVCGYHRHLGEEAPLVGRPAPGRPGGSGTIFFCGCNLSCCFCQNAEISQGMMGNEVEPEDLAAMMLELQEQGCLNINLVSPSHVVPQILAGLWIAARAGLRLPLVYNTGGYDALDTLALLDGVVDIYMPDMKYADAEVGRRLSSVPDYPQVNQAAVREMHRQVGDLVLDAEGIAVRGLLVRHLVLPEGLAGTPEIASFLAQAISPETYVNVMDQYRPCHQARSYPRLDRPISRQEYAEAVAAVRAAGLHRLDQPIARRPWLW